MATGANAAGQAEDAPVTEDTAAAVQDEPGGGTDDAAPAAAETLADVQAAAAPARLAVLSRVADELKADAMSAIKNDERYALAVERIAQEFFQAFGL